MFEVTCAEFVVRFEVLCESYQHLFCWGFRSVELSLIISSPSCSCSEIKHQLKSTLLLKELVSNKFCKQTGKVTQKLKLLTCIKSAWDVTKFNQLLLWIPLGVRKARCYPITRQDVGVWPSLWPLWGQSRPFQPFVSDFPAWSQIPKTSSPQGGHILIESLCPGLSVTRWTVRKSCQPWMVWDVGQIFSVNERTRSKIGKGKNSLEGRLAKWTSVLNTFLKYSSTLC